MIWRHQHTLIVPHVVPWLRCRVNATFYTADTQLWFLGDVHEQKQQSAAASCSSALKLFSAPEQLLSPLRKQIWKRCCLRWPDVAVTHAGASPWPSFLLTQLCWCNHSVTAVTIISLIPLFPSISHSLCLSVSLFPSISPSPSLISAAEMVSACRWLELRKSSN